MRQKKVYTVVVLTLIIGILAFFLTKHKFNDKQVFYDRLESCELRISTTNVPQIRVAISASGERFISAENLKPIILRVFKPTSEFSPHNALLSGAEKFVAERIKDSLNPGQQVISLAFHGDTAFVLSQEGTTQIVFKFQAGDTQWRQGSDTIVEESNLITYALINRLRDCNPLSTDNQPIHFE